MNTNMTGFYMVFIESLCLVRNYPQHWKDSAIYLSINTRAFDESLAVHGEPGKVCPDYI